MAFGGQFTKLSQFIADSITGATIIGGIITGATINATGVLVGKLMTGASAPRWVLGQTGQEQNIIAESGNVNETSPHQITVVGSIMQFTSQLLSSSSHNIPASLSVDGDANAGHDSRMDMLADIIRLLPGNTGAREVFMDENGVSIGGGAAAPIKGLDWGQDTQTTDVNGRTVTLHNCGVPVVHVSIGKNTGTGALYAAEIIGRTATQFTIQWRNSTTGAAAGAGNSPTFTYLAIG